MIDEILLSGEKSINQNIVQINNVYEQLKSVIKIELKEGKGSGFFIKFRRNNKPFYCLMTNQHVVTSELTNKGENILIKYENEKKEKNIELNQKERIIICLKELLNIDISIIEIIPKDQIDDSYFLLPNTNYENNLESLLNKKIQILQYPGGKYLSISEGKISKKEDLIFYHNASTQKGSSGSPIFLKDEKGVIGIHKGFSLDENLNKGIFIIGLIQDIINQKKRFGEGREFYENGKLKYEGNFINDLYEGDGKYFFENDDVYIGQFKNGKPNGEGCTVRNGIILYEGVYENGVFIRSKYEKEKEDKKKFNEIEYQTKEYPNRTPYRQQNNIWSTMIANGVSKGIGNLIGDIISEKLFGKK